MLSSLLSFFKSKNKNPSELLIQLKYILLSPKYDDQKKVLCPQHRHEISKILSKIKSLLCKGKEVTNSASTPSSNHSSSVNNTNSSFTLGLTSSFISNGMSIVDSSIGNGRGMGVGKNDNASSSGSCDLLGQLACEFCSHNLLELLIKNFYLFEFEAKKDVVTIFTIILNRQIGMRTPTVDHILSNPNVIVFLFHGYCSNLEIALFCGMMIRECIKHEQLVQMILNLKMEMPLSISISSSIPSTTSLARKNDCNHESKNMYNADNVKSQNENNGSNSNNNEKTRNKKEKEKKGKKEDSIMEGNVDNRNGSILLPCYMGLFEMVKMTTFDISSDAFATLRDLLTKHPLLISSYLRENHDNLFEQLNEILKSENYAAKRQTLKLLGDILTIKVNDESLQTYTINSDNLKLIMTLMLNKSRNIQVEAFSIFKLFIANPKKTRLIHEILIKNKEKLEIFVANLSTGREDERLDMDKMYVLHCLNNLTIDVEDKETGTERKEIIDPRL